MLGFEMGFEDEWTLLPDGRVRVRWWGYQELAGEDGKNSLREGEMAWKEEVMAWDKAPRWVQEGLQEARQAQLGAAVERPALPCAEPAAPAAAAKPKRKRKA